VGGWGRLEEYRFLGGGRNGEYPMNRGTLLMVMIREINFGKIRYFP